MNVFLLLLSQLIALEYCIHYITNQCAKPTSLYTSQKGLGLGQIGLEMQRCLDLGLEKSLA